MPTSQYWDTSDLKAVLAAPGLVAEDVMAKIWDLSMIPLPFTDLVGSTTAENPYTEWTQDALGAPDLANAVVSGSDATGNNAGVNGARVGNHCQNSVKVVEVSERAIVSQVFGRTDELAYQTMRRQQELKRDVEGIALSPQASVQDNGDAIAGKAGGFPSWLVTNDNNGAGGSATGFNTSTKLVAAPAPGTARALSWATVKQTIQAVYESNGNPTALMSVPGIIAGINTFLLATPTAGAIATPTANVNGGGAGVNQTAQGYINVLVSDFGLTFSLIPNRLQATYPDATPVTPVASADLFMIDPGYVALSYLKAPVMHPLAKLGLADRRMISTDWTVQVYLEKAHGIIRDLIPTAPVVV